MFHCDEEAGVKLARQKPGTTKIKFTLPSRESRKTSAGKGGKELKALLFMI